jgi:anti-sigma regulatory factor (Ser/Thr protein kinase)
MSAFRRDGVHTPVVRASSTDRALPDGSPSVLSLEVQPTPLAGRIARQALDAVGFLDGLHSEAAARVRGIVSELLSNAVAGSPSELPIGVELERSTDRVTVAVTNRGRLDRARLSFSMPDPARPSGRGLALTRLWSTNLEIRSERGTTWVQATVRITSSSPDPRTGAAAASPRGTR